MPQIKVLSQLFETAYAVSLRTEEEQRLQCTLALMDRWSWLHGNRPRHATRCYPFGMPVPKPKLTELRPWLPFDANNLAKLALAADPEVSIIAVGIDENERLMIFGLWDQILHATRFLSRESDKPGSLPGELQCAIEGPGRLSVYRRFRFLAGLDRIQLVRRLSHPLATGAIRKALLVAGSPRIAYEVKQVANFYSRWRHSAPKQLQQALEAQWLNTVGRVVDRIQRYGHGGALAMTRTNWDALHGQLKIKHGVAYERLSLVFGAVCRLETNRYLGITLGAKLQRSARKTTKEEGKTMQRLHGSAEASARIAHYRSELEGAIAFVASLSRIDGLVLCDLNLNVMGFGVEILLKEDPPNLYIATDAIATHIIPRQITAFGMRHRSMMRLCWNNPHTVGFVVSQDGDIRVIARTTDKLLMWDNVDLRQLWLGNNWA